MRWAIRKERRVKKLIKKKKKIDQKHYMKCHIYINDKNMGRFIGSHRKLRSLYLVFLMLIK